VLVSGKSSIQEDGLIYPIQKGLIFSVGVRGLRKLPEHICNKPIAVVLAGNNIFSSAEQKREGRKLNLETAIFLRD
jgi:hypothetical protein